MLRVLTVPRLVATIVLLLLAALPSAAAAPAATAPPLGTAASFAVLGGSTVTNTGSTVLTGDLGVSPGTAITGFGPGIVNGTIHSNDTAAQNAQTDATTAYNTLAGQTCTTVLTGQDLGSLPALTPGVYCFDTSAQLTGALTLDAQGDANAVWVFKIGSTLMTASNSSVSIINGGSACKVFWQVGSSATLGTGTQFIGNILALTSITLTTSSSIVPGRALAHDGAVTLDTNNITGSTCTPTAVGLLDFRADRLSGQQAGGLSNTGIVVALLAGVLVPLLVAISLVVRQSARTRNGNLS